MTPCLTFMLPIGANIPLEAVTGSKDGNPPIGMAALPMADDPGKESP